ncbi:hypothetical protein X798_04943 [Onchocerca flexuosa]|uniref:Uncharacterized protein n=1 Tax=Onchocerca flexuosa TaxID=387005 RepID=A0A238BRR6_9BILA|nr:hypothetical protein X798_04943 [Onchocerca flexuosa]
MKKVMLMNSNKEKWHFTVLPDGARSFLSNEDLLLMDEKEENLYYQLVLYCKSSLFCLPLFYGTAAVAAIDYFLQFDMTFTVAVECLFLPSRALSVLQLLLPLTFSMKLIIPSPKMNGNSITDCCHTLNYS